MRLGAALALLVAMFGCSSEPSTAAPPAASADKPTDQSADAKALLKRLAEFYRRKNASQFAFEQKISIQVDGVKNNVESTARIVVERPNKLSLLQKSTQPGIDIVCDGPGAGRACVRCPSWPKWPKSIAKKASLFTA